MDENQNITNTKRIDATQPVIIHHLVAEGTVDEQVMKALQAKDTSQAALLAALKERRTG